MGDNIVNQIIIGLLTVGLGLLFAQGFCVMMLAIFDMIESFGDELHDYFDGEDE